MEKLKAYAGIGSRKTPTDILTQMEYIARAMYKEGYTLRSGGAHGADQAFEYGLSTVKDAQELVEIKAEIYLPWPTFERENRSWISPIRRAPQPEAFEIAEKYHPSWRFLSQAAKKFHARNVHQIYGYDVTSPVYSELVICWTEGHRGGGGTGQALRIANDLEIPVFDLADEKAYKELQERFNGSFIF